MQKKKKNSIVIFFFFFFGSLWSKELLLCNFYVGILLHVWAENAVGYEREGVLLMAGSHFVLTVPSQSVGPTKSWQFWVFRMKTQLGLRAKQNWWVSLGFSSDKKWVMNNKFWVMSFWWWLMGYHSLTIQTRPKAFT